ncbi:MAG: DNA translocase FtsK 4TM domain-containing protein [Bacillota bacterium]
MTVKRNTKKRQLKLQAVGLLIVALGLFLAFSIYFDSAGIIGFGVARFLLGVFGLGAYMMPVIAFVAGLYIVFTSKKSVRHFKILFAICMVICVLCLIHLTQYAPHDGQDFMAYLNDSFSAGIQHQIGGGIFAGMFVFPFHFLLGTVGSYILYSVITLICITLLFSLSLREMGKNVNTRVKSARQRRKERVAITQENKRQRMQEEAEELRPNRPRQPLFVDTLEKEDPNRTVPDPTLEKPDLRPRTPTPDKAAAPEASADNSVFAAAAAQKAGVEYEKPPITLLTKQPARLRQGSRAQMEGNAEKLEKTLESFGIKARVTQVTCGPTVTQYEVLPAPGVRVSRISGLSDNIALDLAAPSVRIEAPIPGKSAIGIEVPNKEITTVYLRDALESPEFVMHPSNLCFALGKSIYGKNIIADLGKMPHLLIAGATGSGKSVCVNNLIISLLYKSSPEQVRMIMIDPKMVELSCFSDVPHLLVPVVTDAKKAAEALNWATREMDNRYAEFSRFQVRDLHGFNRRAAERGEKPLPHLVVIIDELADLMMVSPRDVEDAICRLAQKGRASGIHLVIATQRPSVNVITGVIKANIPSRIAFSVSSQVDSRTILDMGGAEKLLGRGDMLYYPLGTPKPMRLQGAYVSDKEVGNITTYMRSRYQIQYDEKVESEIFTPQGSDGRENGRIYDEKLVQALEIAVESGQVSISMLQRRMQIGYSRAGRIIDELEQMGCISGFSGSKSRNVLITREEFEERFLK